MEIETEVLEIIQRTENVKSFRFKTEKDISFKPGQHFLVTIRNGDKDLTKPFSISNSPSEKGYLEFTKRLSDSEYSQTLNKLKPGDCAKLKLPYGEFTFEGECSKTVFLAGGIGITPFRSMCGYAADTGLKTDIVLIYGCNAEQDIIFREDFNRMTEKNENFRAVYVLMCPPDAGRECCGKIGLINAQMIKEVVPDFGERVFYYCGPPRMIEYMDKVLREELLVPDDRLKKEHFPGY